MPGYTGQRDQCKPEQIDHLLCCHKLIMNGGEDFQFNTDYSV
jgi:hypothetical protein